MVDIELIIPLKNERLFKFFFMSLECKYDDVAFSDCDPIKLTKWREKHLIAGAPSCQKTKNETKSCDASDFPPGNMMLNLLLIFKLISLIT